MDISNLSEMELEKMLKQKRKQKKKNRRKWRFSEKVIFWVLLFSILVYVSAIVFAFINRADSIWAYLIPSVGVLASSGFSAFLWKEKNENLSKILANPNFDREQLRQEVEEELINELRNLDKGV